MLSETELIMHLSQYNDWCVEDADDGDIGYYAYAEGGYLPNCYQSPHEALLAIQDYFEGGA